MALHGGAMLLAPAGGYSGYAIDQSMVLDGSTDFLSRAFSTPTSDKIMTWSIWVKNCDTDYATYGNWAGYNTGTNYGLFGYDGTNNRFRFGQYNPTTVNLISTAFFRDTAYSHFVVTVDTTEATSSDRVKVWHNGVQITDFDTATYPSLNQSMIWNSAINHAFGGAYSSAGALYHPLNGYLAEIHFIDGTAYEATEFGEFYNGTSAWRAIQPSGLTYGTNGFHLDFASDTPNLGTDQSGNNNDWTENGSPVQSGDSPTRNLCTLNELSTGTTPTLSNGNLTMATTSGADLSGVVSTIAPQTGKWYWECEIKAASTYPYIGIAVQTDVNRASAADRGSYFSAAFRPSGAFVSTSNELGTITGTTTGVSFATNDILMFALDCDNNKLFMGKNGTWFNSADPVAGTNEQISWVNSNIPIHAAISGYNGQGNGSTYRFASEDWSYTAPTDYIDISAANLPDPTITDPGEHFNVVGYTASNSTKSITGVGFQPDWTWHKNRTEVNRNALFDVLRGATNRLASGQTDVEVADADTLTSFDSDGFSIGADTGQYGVNDNGSQEFITWCWKAGGAGVANSDGSISSTVSVNDDAGFSIVSYTGTGSAGTVGHGQSAPPELIIVRNRDIVANWITFHHLVASDPETDYLLLDTTTVANDLADIWNDTAPTASVFSVGSNTNTNGNTNDLIAYCFRSIPGYSKVFSYIANGSADGPFIWLGFRARWIIIKSSTRAEGWYIYDTERSTFNEVDDILRADSNTSEATTADIDINCNGIKVRTTHVGVNSGSNTQIGIAFAENPFGGSNIPLGLAR